MTRNIGMLLLGLYLILVAIGPIFGIVTAPLVVGIIALLAAIFIILGK